jgi:hypothetical protein
MDMKLELVPVPVSDVDRAKAFYTEKLGFALEVDRQVEGMGRIVQLTPPGSACSIVIGLDIETMPYESFALFSDPDGNGWSLQEGSVSSSWLRPRLTGRRSVRIKRVDQRGRYSNPRAVRLAVLRSIARGEFRETIIELHQLLRHRKEPASQAVT